jgi:hypothetical protein
MSSSSDFDPPFARVVAPPPARPGRPALELRVPDLAEPAGGIDAPAPAHSQSAALGVAALLCGLVPLAAAVLAIGIMASEGEGHRSPPGTVVISLTDVVSLGLFFIGAPLGGIASLVNAWRNAERHRGPDGTPLGRNLSFYAVASTLLGWALCAGIVIHIMSTHAAK